ncbi:MAG: hypothetical protein WBD31_22070 [Rubripirellula sp.]
MHLLTCPACQDSIPVTTSQAGERMTCPACQSPVDVPTLGQLRKLPVTEESAAQSPELRETAGGGSIAFGVFGLIATAALLVAGFCGIRWALIDIPINTESHIAEFEQAYQEIEAAQLIREYEQMEEFGVDVAMPYKYKTLANTKSDWGWSSAIAGAVAAIAIILATIFGIAGRKRN